MKPGFSDFEFWISDFSSHPPGRRGAYTTTSGEKSCQDYDGAADPSSNLCVSPLRSAVFDSPQMLTGREPLANRLI